MTHAPIPFDNSYVRLPDRLFARVAPDPAPAPHLLALNRALCADLGIDADALETEDGARWLSGAATPPGAEPIAMAYAGHQFGGWVPSLGDGRALLLGEVVGRDGVRRDIHLKGSGRTPFSRGGDGKAALGPVLREYLVAEAMHALGVPTTRALAAVATGAPVYRETVLPGAVLTRVARGHVRVGTFQYLYARDDAEGLAALVDYCLKRMHPGAEGPSPARALLDAVAAAQARLIARWMALGFIHGVMNTDNMSVAGETIDYGPCAFMDAFHPATVFSSIDRQGRYAWGAQPTIGHWNLSRLAQALLPVMDADPDAAQRSAQAAVDAFPDLYGAAWTAEMRAKLGLETAEATDGALAQALLKRMADDGADFTLTFRALAAAAEGDDAPFLERFTDRAAAAKWLAAWRARAARDAGDPAARADALRRANPAFVPRNHQVEKALTEAYEGDLGPFRRLHAVLARPFDDQPEAADLSLPPAPGEEVRATFCGT
jgi:uncharacterized protein YdiU (UPF0061 family)